jgi:membrane-bound ClpP family serine protease
VLDELIHLVTQVFISCVLLFVGLGVLLFELGDPATQKLAAGWIGAVLGYWLQ